MGPSACGSGRLSNFSISGKEISTVGLPSCADRSISGKRCRVCGPNTISTCGARLRMVSPSWEATQPPTPITKPGLCFFQCFQVPSNEKTLSCAFSRMEQVLSSRTSASSGVSTRTRSCDCASKSDILAESYSFI